METKFGESIPWQMWVGLEKMLKLVSFRLETQADTTLPAWQKGSLGISLKEMARTGQARTSSVFQTTRCVKFRLHM
jgi:hypothetical protein